MRTEGLRYVLELEKRFVGSLAVSRLPARLTDDCSPRCGVKDSFPVPDYPAHDSLGLHRDVTCISVAID